MSNIDVLLCSMEGGVLISIFMFGLFNLQVFVYYRHYPNDPWVMKILVAVQWILEVTHAILVCHALYTMTISNYTTPDALLRPPWSLNILGLFDGVIIMFAQGFFATRIHTCFGSLYVSSLCWTLALLRFVGAIGTTVYSLTRPTFPHNQHKLDAFLTAVLVISAVVDAIIASSLCYQLFRVCRNSMPRRMTRIIDRVIIITIPTGLALSVFAIAMLICSLTTPHISALTAMMLFEAELFSISMLANLNGRLTLRESDVRDSEQCPTKPQLNFVHNKTTRLTELSLDRSTSSDLNLSNDKIDATKPIDV